MRLMERLFDFVGNQDDCQTARSQIIDNLVNACFGANVNTDSRRIQDENPRISRQPFGKHHALLVATGQFAYRPVCGLCFDVQIVYPSFDRRRALATIDKAEKRLLSGLTPRPRCYRQSTAASPARAKDDLRKRTRYLCGSRPGCGAKESSCRRSGSCRNLADSFQTKRELAQSGPNQDDL